MNHNKSLIKKHITWKKLKLGSLIELEYGKGLPETKRVNGKFNVYGSNGIIGSHSDFHVEGPAIIIGRKGSAGEIHYSEDNFWPIDTTFYIKNNKKYDLKFIFYLLKTIDFRRLNSDSAVPGLNRNAAYDVEVNIPKEINEQNKIGDFLFSLDEKINLNQKIIFILEKIGFLLYKKWFIYFYFPDKNGKPYKANYGDMKESELGRIPLGWSVKKGEELFTLEYGKHLPQWDREEGIIPVFGSGGLTGFHNKEYVKDCGIIVGRAGKIGNEAVYYCHTGFFPLETTYYVSPKDNIFIYYIYYTLKNMQIENTGSSVPNLSRNDVHNKEIILPDIEVLKIFNEKIFTLQSIIHNNKEENKRLIKIRDILLPKLISGEIEI